MAISVFSGVISYGLLVRNSMIAVTGEDYILTAWAKGLYKHTFRNALLPLITNVGMSMAGLMGGSVLMEKIFSWPGMGQLLLEACNTGDYLLSQYGACSDTCLPWQGKVYIDDVFQPYYGPRGGSFGVSRNGRQYMFPSVAVKAGLFHPNCRHTISTWIEGVSTWPDPMNIAEIGRVNKLEAEQRRLEREVRQAKREVEGLTDPKAVQDAKRKLRVCQGALRKFVDENSDVLRRDYWRERDTGVPELAADTPQVEVVPANQRTDAPKPVLEKTAPKYVDITGQWYKDAIPNSHPVRDLHSFTVNGTTYKVDGHNVVLDYSPYEKEIAELLEREVGGEIFMVPRVNNPQGVSTPDFLFHGKGYDLKTIGKTSGKNPIVNRVKKAKKQARNFIIDVTKSELSDDILNAQIVKIYSDVETEFVDEIVIIRDKKILKVAKRT